MACQNKINDIKAGGMEMEKKIQRNTRKEVLFFENISKFYSTMISQNNLILIESQNRLR